jgi:cytochrome d ubiquinol oxidase subunit II
LAVLVSFALAGIWVWLGIDGYVIQQMPPPDALPNPVNKVVTLGDGAWLHNYRQYPLSIAAPLLGLLGAFGVYKLAAQDKKRLSFLNSSLSLVGIILTAGVSLFPFIMPSSLNPNHSLTIWDSASSHLTLNIMFWATVIFVPLIVIYTLWCYRALWGKVTVKFIRDNDHSVY